MEHYRLYYCSCSGKPLELVPVSTLDEDTDEPLEPTCPKCGATPSSDPKHTIHYRDVSTWDD